MKAEIKNPLMQKFSNAGDYPNKLPNKNYIPFENPRDKCSMLLCPNFSKTCGLCDLHCRKIHKGKHTKDKDLEELIDKYLKRNEK